MNVLVVTNCPLMPINSGYKQSVWGRINDLIVAENSVTVFQIDYESVSSYVRRTEANQDECSDKVRFFEMRPPRNSSVFHELSRILSFKTRNESLFSDSALARTVSRLVDELQPDLIVAESIWCLGVLPRNLDIPLHLVVHDVSSDFYREMMLSTPQRLKKCLYFIDWVKLFFREKYIINDKRITKYVFLTDEDRSCCINRYGLMADCCFLAANRLVVKSIVRRCSPRNAFLLFPGSVDFSQNFYALKWFCERVLPLTSSAPKVVVTGAASISNRAAFGKYTGIEFSGELPKQELEKLYASCACVVAPILTGTGVKIKILEATQMGVPVVATKFASKGIRSPLCIHGDDDSPETFSELLRRFCENAAVENVS